MYLGLFEIHQHTTVRAFDSVLGAKVYEEGI